MEITPVLKGSLEEMESYMDEKNSVDNTSGTVRNYSMKKENCFLVTLRVTDDFKEPKLKTISAYREATSIYL